MRVAEARARGLTTRQARAAEKQQEQGETLPAPVESAEEDSPEQIARQYILNRLNGVYGETREDRAIQPRNIAEFTGWDAAKVRRFITKVQDEWRLSQIPEQRKGGLSELIAAISEDDEDAAFEREMAAGGQGRG